MRSVRLPYRILKILEGESLLNDASALLIYRIAAGAAMASSLRLEEVAPALTLALIGSLVAGYVLAQVMVRLLGRITDVPTAIIMQFATTFVVWIVAVLASLLLVRDLVAGAAGIGFTLQIVLWLWFTVLFANFAEAIAERRGKAQADSLRETRTRTKAKRLLVPGNTELFEMVWAEELSPGDLVVVEAGDLIPGDGEVVEGMASVNEAAITGESAPVIRESGGDRSAVTGGTTVISDRIVVKITAAKGSSFLDRMIALIEGAARQKTPNEIALNILLAGLSLSGCRGGAVRKG